MIAMFLIRLLVHRSPHPPRLLAWLAPAVFYSDVFSLFVDVHFLPLEDPGGMVFPFLFES
jgi:hypothetical protein